MESPKWPVCFGGRMCDNPDEMIEALEDVWVGEGVGHVTDSRLDRYDFHVALRDGSAVVLIFQEMEQRTQPQPHAQCLAAWAKPGRLRACPCIN